MSNHQKTQLTQYLTKQVNGVYTATELYQLFANHLNSNGDWLLLGTDGCHLCDEMALFLKKQAVRFNLPPIIQLEILHFLSKDDSDIFEQLSYFIPILITPHDFLCYPFGAMDILALKNYH